MGETKRILNIRGEEHITGIKSASKRSHTAEHCWTYIHNFEWEHKKVLNFEKNWKTRTIEEAIYSEASYQWNILQITKYLEASYYEKAKQRKQAPKLQQHQTEPANVRQQIWFHTGPQPKSTNQKRP